jgi:hypothetical protein
MSQGQNFCPKYQKHIQAAYSQAARSYLTTLPQSKESTHTQCTIDQCRGRVSRLDNGHKHCNDCQGCGLVGPSLEDVKACIKDGGIPLLRFQTSRQGKFKIEVVRASFETRYVAVSHVWTGGLGNPDANELYECQLRKITATGPQIRRIIERERMPSFPNMFRQIYRKLVLGDIKSASRYAR